MQRFKIRSTLVSFVVCFAAGFALSEGVSTERAHASVSVAIGDPSYRSIEKLEALGLIRDAIYTQRPWTREEFARLTLEASREIDVQCANCALRSEMMAAVDHLKKKFADEIEISEGANPTWRIRMLNSVDLFAAGAETHERNILRYNGLGYIDATLNPFTENREGARIDTGANVAIRTDHWASYSDRFSIYAQPEYEGSGLFSSSGASRINLHKAYLNLALNPLSLQIGRDSLAWGPSEFGGGILSTNARPLDMIMLSSPSPIELPWVLKYLGPFKGSLFVADLGTNRESPHSKLVGISLSIRPISLLELNFAHTMIAGGVGMPSSFGNEVSEFFFVRPCLGACGNFANHLISGSWKLRIPPLANVEWYADLTWEDLGFDSISADFGYRLTRTTGLYFPIAFSDFGSDLRIEYSHASPLSYRHSPFVSGYALDQRILGLSSGPGSDQVSVSIRHDLAQERTVALRMSANVFDGNTYHQENEVRLVLDQSVPREKRARVSTEYSWKIRDDLTLIPMVGFERVWNFDFEAGRSVNNIIGAAFARYQPE